MTIHVSSFRIEPKQILRLNNNFYNIKLGNFKCTNEDGLRLGYLGGNRFKLAIREVETGLRTEDINETIEALRNNGFVNYFGTQRFGTCIDVPTHSIGKKVK